MKDMTFLLNLIMVLNHGIQHQEPWYFYDETLDNVPWKSRTQPTPLVRLVLYYASPSWDPTSSEDNVKLFREKTE